MAITEYVPRMCPLDCPPDTRAFLDDQFRKLAPIVNSLVQGEEAMDLSGPYRFRGRIGFFGAEPITKPVGVPVTAAGIHAALVTLGLIEA